MVMSDADATMGAVITECCRDGGIFPNASVCSILKGIFQEFGCNSRRLGLRQSRTSRRKGGEVIWGHDWQRQLVTSIYQCQRCESEAELAACKQWIHDLIELNPELSKYLKRQLHQFFTRKFYSFKRKSTGYTCIELQ
jgi:hypothetical protein